MAVKGRNSHNLLLGARGPFIYVNGRQILMTYQYYNFLSDNVGRHVVISGFFYSASR